MSFPCTVCAPEAPKRPQKACQVNVRKGTCVKRVGYISCTSAVDPFTLIGQSENAVYTALNAMLAVNPAVIGYTGLLSNAEFADPQQLIELNADCQPAFITTGTRDITYKDYNGFDVDQSGGDLPYFEYDMYETLNQNGSNYVYFHVDCNNDLWLYYRSVNGSYLPLAASFYAVKSEERLSVGNSIICKQVINVTLSFIGDPINLGVKPLVNLNAATGLLANLL